MTTPAVEGLTTVSYTHLNGIGEALDAVLEGYDASNIEQVTLSTTVVTRCV